MKKLSALAVIVTIGILAAGCTPDTGQSLSPSTTPGSTVTKGSAESEQTTTTAVTDGEITGTITVSCYESALHQALLEEAAKQFEQLHPGTKVNIETFSSMPEINSSEQDGERVESVNQTDDPQSRADYISKTSTSLMSGQGADLLAMDVLPIQKYVASGQLEDLNQYIKQDPDFNRADYRENLLDALEFQNGLWFLPMDYGFDYYAYDSSLVKGTFGAGESFTTKQLMEMGKSGYDGTNMIFPSPAYLPDGKGDLFSQLFRENYSSFIDTNSSKANFTDSRFYDMISEIKELADEGYIKQRIGSSGDATDLMQQTTQDPTERFQFKPKTQFSLVQQTHPDPEFKMMVATTAVGSGIEDDDQIAGICAEEGGVVPFTYGQAFGINANSTNKTTAWAFLKFLLSYDVQVSPNMSILTLPIHNEARKDRTVDLYKMLLTGGADLDAESQQALDTYLTTVETMSDQMNGYTFKDTMIQDMVIKEMAYFFDGSKTADQICEVLQSKVSLYLNE